MGSWAEYSSVGTWVDWAAIGRVGTGATRALVEALLDRGADGDVAEAEAAIERLSAAPADEAEDRTRKAAAVLFTDAVSTTADQLRTDNG